MADRVPLEQLQSCDGPAFRELYEIYAVSIAARERKDERWICAMMQAPEYRFWVKKHAERIAGFSIVFLPAEERFALLEYMAVRPEQRNRGLGSALFQETTKRVPDLPMVLEVDSDREASGDREIRTRRQQFYRRLGCVRIAGLRYILPLPGEGPVPEMDLMLYSGAPVRQLPKSELEHWLRAIYRDVYRASPDDPRITEMLRALPNPVRLD